MRRRLVVGLLAVLGVAAVTGSCSTDNPNEASGPNADVTQSTASDWSTISPAPNSTTPVTSPPASSTVAPIDPVTTAIDKLIATLNPRQRVAQLLVLGTVGPNLAEPIETELNDLCIGGVFVTSSNENWTALDTTDTVRDRIGALRASASSCPVAPLIATDAEPGTTVLRVPIEPLASPDAWAADYRRDPEASRLALAAATAGFAIQLAEVGIDVNFGVVADVDISEDSYMRQTGRSFGDDPSMVTALTETLVDGHCQVGVAPTLKHFPNQGASSSDPHRSDALADTTRDRWAQNGAVPYQATQAPLVMVGHLRFGEVDGQLPASLSSTIIQGWLREQLGYQGVVITDDLLAMEGLPGELSNATRAVAAVTAGADLALFVDVDGAADTIEALLAARAADETMAAAMDRHLVRVLRLKAALGLLDDIDPAAVNLCRAR